MDSVCSRLEEAEEEKSRGLYSLCTQAEGTAVGGVEGLDSCDVFVLGLYSDTMLGGHERLLITVIGIQFLKEAISPGTSDR